MPLLSTRASGYLRAWLRGPRGVRSDEVVLDRGDRSVAATVVRPAHAGGSSPAWVVLHGMTPTGREHAQLARFTQALAASGAVAMVPDVPEWRALRLAPDVARPTVAAALRTLRSDPAVGDRPVGVIGFSFGAPHAIATASDPGLAGRIAGVVGFGGYCDLESTFRFMMADPDVDARTGAGTRIVPDPYGRWIVGANYLSAVPGLEGGDEVGEALGSLAAHAGTLTIPSWDETYDPYVHRLRTRVSARYRELFDLFTPRTGLSPDPATARSLAVDLARVARDIDPGLDPVPALGRVDRPAHILHGRNDRLIACAEALKLREALPAHVDASLTITELFGHSSRDRFRMLSALREIPRFTRALSALLALP